MDLTKWNELPPWAKGLAVLGAVLTFLNGYVYIMTPGEQKCRDDLSAARVSEANLAARLEADEKLIVLYQKMREECKVTLSSCQGVPYERP